jgi:exosortase
VATTSGVKAPSVPLENARTALPWTSWACLLLAGGVVLYPLSYAWGYLDNYAFGWWVPLLAMFLFWERWGTRPAPGPTGRRPETGRFILGWAILFFAFRMALESSLSSRPLLWCCALLYVGALLYWMWVYGGAAWLRHFAFPICFLLISVPWPTPLEDPVVQGLAQFNAWLVAHVLVIGGVEAQATGNVIVLANCTLGIEEACSGIRSLQAALMVALLLGELYRFPWPRRGRIILLALGLALVGNFLRAMFLAVLASSRGVSVMDQWHDAAGVFILVFTSVTAWLVCAFLHQRAPRGSPPVGETSPPVWSPWQGGMAQRLAWGILLVAVAGDLATEGWYAWRERGAAQYPTWTAMLPSSGTFKELAIPEESHAQLRDDAGREVEWLDNQGWTWTAYWFRYHPKPVAEIVFQNHNPDVCLPSTGFVKVADEEMFAAEVHGIRLQVYPKEFSWKGAPVYVFWVVYANRATFPVEKAVEAGKADPVARVRRYLSDIWHARRTSTSEMESLEAIVIGPENYAAAQAGYLTELQKIVVPDAGGAAADMGTAGP